MSGGAYNYLCYNADEVISRRRDVEMMGRRLENSGYYGAARATRNVLVLAEAAERAATALQEVWLAVEWADSGDSSEAKVREAVAEFSPWPPEP